MNSWSSCKHNHCILKVEFLHLFVVLVTLKRFICAPMGSIERLYYTFKILISVWPSRLCLLSIFWGKHFSKCKWIIILLRCGFAGYLSDRKCQFVMSSFIPKSLALLSELSCSPYKSRVPERAAERFPHWGGHMWAIGLCCFRPVPLSSQVPILFMIKSKWNFW